MSFDQLIALRSHKVLENHLFYQVGERDLRCPSQLFSRFASVTEETLHFCRAKITRIDSYNYVTVRIVTFLFLAGTGPLNSDVQLAGCQVNEFADAILLTSGYDTVLRLLLLQH